MKHICYTIGLILIGVIKSSAQTAVFVSPNGKDQNIGTLELPFRSIQRAQSKARELKGEVVIYLREGEYRLKETLIFTPKDGNEDKILTLCPYQNEHVVIKGNELLNIHSWQLHKNGIMKAKVNLSSPADLLIVNGEIRHLARFPNNVPNAVRFNGTSSEATSPKRIKSWKKTVGGFLHAMHAHDWGDFHYRITGKDPDGNLQLEGGQQNNRKLGLHPDNRMVENIFEELDAPGEWFYDSSKSTLYYYPLIDEKIQMGLFEVPMLKHLVEFRGSEYKPVKNITRRY